MVSTKFVFVFSVLDHVVRQIDASCQTDVRAVPVAAPLPSRSVAPALASGMQGVTYISTMVADGCECRPLYRSYSPGSEAVRSACRAAEHVRSGSQSQNH